MNDLDNNMNQPDDNQSDSTYHYVGDPYKTEAYTSGSETAGSENNTSAGTAADYNNTSSSDYGNNSYDNSNASDSTYSNNSTSGNANSYSNASGSTYSNNSTSGNANSYSNAYSNNSYNNSNTSGNSYNSYANNQQAGPDRNNNSQNYSNAYYAQPPQHRKNGFGSFIGKVGKIAGTALLFGIVAGVAFAGVAIIKDQLYTSKSSQISLTTTDSKATDSTDGTGSDTTGSNNTKVTDVSSIVDNVMPSVVSITCTIQTQNYFYGTQESSGAGSGFIIAKTDKVLMIATNNHVVEDATSLKVGFVDDTTASATVVGKDSDSDLAVISVKLDDITDDTASKIKVAVLGDSDKLKVGQSVIAIGNALGYGQSVTTGVISAKDREVSFTDGTLTLLQTDAAINPGNSGGVLVNTDGEVIGINNAKLEDTSVEGMGYAIPMSTAKTILTDLMNETEVAEGDEAFLGIVGRTIDSTYADALGMPEGVYVTQVISGSPAETAGISAGDIITKFDGNTVSSMDGLKEKVSMKKKGTEITITIKRQNQNGEYKEEEVKVTLGRKGDFEDATSDSSSDSNSSDSSNDNSNGNSDGSSDNGNYYYYGNGDGSGSDDNSDYYTNPYYYFFGNGSGNY